jgi:RNA ligase (TIGR02306 family)
VSEFHVEVVTVGPIQKHPNADALSITTIKNGYPVIIRTGEFIEGNKAVYLPIDSLVPVSDPRFAFLANKDKPRERERVKAKRLRGIFSMGLLVKADPAWNVGQNVQAELNILKYEPPEPMMIGGEDEKDPGFLPTYTDIEGLRKYSHLLIDGEEVVLTEKLHGTNAKFLWKDDRLWVGGHHTIKREDPENLYWKEALKNGLKEKLAQVPNIALYGEIFGWVQSLRYDLPKGTSKLAFFDAMDTGTRRYLDYDEFVALLQKLGLPQVPVLYRGPWSKELWKHAEGSSTIAKHIREGFVVRPVKERFHQELGGRVVLKLVGEEYLLKG